MRLVAVRAEELDTILPDVLHFIERLEVESGHRITVDRFVSDIRSGHRQLWLGCDTDIRTIAMTEVADDTKSTVRLTHCAGDGPKDWVFLIEGIREWARQRGSEAFEVIGRVGWERFLKHHGFKRAYVVMEG